VVIKCPECGFVMPLSALVDMVWCPCGWKDEKVYNRHHRHNRQTVAKSDS
jgi:hypothetical protein